MDKVVLRSMVRLEDKICSLKVAAMLRYAPLDHYHRYIIIMIIIITSSCTEPMENSILYSLLGDYIYWANAFYAQVCSSGSEMTTNFLDKINCT